MRKSLLAVALFTFILAGSAVSHGQQVVVPGYSTQRVDMLVHAIAKAEGFGVHGAIPTRKHNPGDLRWHGKYRVFKSDAEGWAALRAQVVRVIEGRSRVYRLSDTLSQVGRKYAGSRVWAVNVSRSLHITGDTTLEAWVCEGDLDIAPRINT